ncbi:MAG: LPS assembly lipoprotein LptE [Chitinispirillaceae bacterium]
MIRKSTILLTSMLFSLLIGCGIYSFSGSTLPNHLKTVELPVFANSTMEPGVADEITSALENEIMKSQLSPVNNDADATISGTVMRYSNDPHTFGAAKEDSDVDVERYRVRISAKVEFFDNTNGEIIYEGSVSGEGTYDFQSETEEIGRRKAIEELVRQIIQNSVQSW